MADKPADVICEGNVCRKVTPEEAAASGAPATTPRVLSLLGSSLLGKDGAEVPTASITGPKKVLALYFSAHWCPPCRHFTPHLATIYKRFKESHARAADWEVVFISSDRDEDSFKEYFADMPWLALPYAQRDTKNEFSKLFKVRGIPTLVLVDGDTGEVITTNGRDAVGDDEECANFPWIPKTFTQILEGAMLVDPVPSAGEGDKSATVASPTPYPAKEKLAGKVTLLYFSASWCPPCRRFTPKLVEAMAALRAAGKEVEAVFVSGDRKEEDMREYHSHMTWPALPFSDRSRASELNTLFDVEGIPTLVVLDENYKVITAEGVGAVSSDPSGKRFPWHPQPLEQLSDATASRINSGPVLLLVADAPDDEAAEAFGRSTLEATAVAAKATEDGKEWAFLWARRDADITVKVLEFVGGVKETTGPALVLLDVPNAQAMWDLGAQGVEISASGLAKVVADYKAGKFGPGRSLDD